MYALLTGALLLAFPAVTSAEEDTPKDVNVLGIFDQISLQETGAEHVVHP